MRAGVYRNSLYFALHCEPKTTLKIKLMVKKEICLSLLGPGLMYTEIRHKLNPEVANLQCRLNSQDLQVSYVKTRLLIREMVGH